MSNKSVCAIEKSSGKIVSPHKSTKGKDFICAKSDCGRKVILCKGEKKVAYFRHTKDTTTCDFYNHPFESPEHRNAKICCVDLLRKYKNIKIIQSCSCCHKQNIIDIVIEDTHSIKEEHILDDKNHRADVAVFDTNDVNNIHYVFEIFYTHKTSSEVRKEPWFEIDAVDFIKLYNRFDGKDIFSINCIRTDIVCNDCVLKKYLLNSQRKITKYKDEIITLSKHIEKKNRKYWEEYVRVTVKEKLRTYYTQQEIWKRYLETQYEKVKILVENNFTPDNSWHIYTFLCNSRSLLHKKHIITQSSLKKYYDIIPILSKCIYKNYKKLCYDKDDRKTRKMWEESIQYTVSYNLTRNYYKRCEYIYQRGPKKGQQCEQNNYFESNFCSKHARNKEILPMFDHSNDQTNKNICNLFHDFCDGSYTFNIHFFSSGYRFQIFDKYEINIYEEESEDSNITTMPLLEKILLKIVEINFKKIKSSIRVDIINHKHKKIMDQLKKYDNDSDGYTLKNTNYNDYKTRDIYKKQSCKWNPFHKKWILPFFDITDKKIREEKLNFLKSWGILKN